MVPFQILPALVFFYTFHTSFSLSIPSLNGIQKRADSLVNIQFDNVDSPIEEFQTPGAEDGPTRNVEDPRQEIQNAADRATEMALTALNTLRTQGVEQTPEFALFFGSPDPQRLPQLIQTLITLYQRVSDIGHIQNTRTIHFDLRNTPPANEGTGHTYASTHGDQITVFQDFWRFYVPETCVAPVMVSADDEDIVSDLDGLRSRATVILHEMFHVVGEDDPPIGVLDLESDPPETSEEQELLPLSNDPDHAILNPESLASYAMVLYYGAFAPQPASDRYAPVTVPVGMVHVPDVLSRLGEITVNRYGNFNNPSPPGSETWYEFKKNGTKDAQIGNNFLWDTNIPI